MNEQVASRRGKNANLRQWVIDTAGDGRMVACRGCGSGLRFEDVTLDRYPIPGRWGGRHRQGNVRAMCRRCNNSCKYDPTDSEVLAHAARHKIVFRRSVISRRLGQILLRTSAAEESASLEAQVEALHGAVGRFDYRGFEVSNGSMLRHSQVAATVRERRLVDLQISDRLCQLAAPHAATIINGSVLAAFSAWHDDYLARLLRLCTSTRPAANVGPLAGLELARRVTTSAGTFVNVGGIPLICELVEPLRRHDGVELAGCILEAVGLVGSSS